MQESVGRTFGDFVVKEAIGQGGAGEVFRAEQLTLGREAVVKVMSLQSGGSTENAERFLREARLASRLDHPFAAHVYAFGAENDGTLWIAMELVRGTPLDALLTRGGPIPPARFVPLFERLCEVLHAAHEQGIVHRDVKPGNVMVLQRAGRLIPKLLDLGIARVRGVTDQQAEKLLELDLDLPADAQELNQSLVGRLARSETLSITQAGSVVGTPHFMAPEQWVDASTADARSDIYSLSLLAWQSLSGRLPFEGKNLRALARAHATQALPPLPAGLPRALDEVLARGAAKKPAERFATALELASAVRAASGLGLDDAPLPQLPESVRDNVLAEAPQPIAEAVALLESARSARQLIEHVTHVGHTLCRYIGLLALAARMRVGEGRPAHVEALASRSLTPPEWLELASTAVAPFVQSREAHPLPELVRYLRGAPGDGAPAVRALELLSRAEAPAPQADDSAVLTAATMMTAQLARSLESASVLFDYALVVMSREPERWMGARRTQRLPQKLAAGTTIEPGAVWLVDAVGCAVLRLSPLVQAIAPSAGLAPELFFLEGQGRHGARLVAWPSSYERQDDALWRTLAGAGLLDDTTTHQRADERAPYKGLSTFAVEDADNYFGREAESEAFANRLRREPFLALVGPSGTGKSSFVLAGVLPLLPSTYRALTFRPGALPRAALLARLRGAFGVADAAMADPVQVLELLRPDETLVLVIDQFEELVTLCTDVQARDDFAETLLGLARHPSGKVRIVVTLRDDFLIKIQQLRAFRDTLSSALQLLGTPAPEQLVRVVTEPARRVGFEFDDPQLPRRMVDSVADTPGALALLSFAAAQLWELRDRHLRLMRAKTYEALGGVGGALALHAETTLAAMTEHESKLVREAFRHLVTAQSTRAVLGQQELLEVLGGDALAERVISQLTNARLLVSSENATGENQIEIIHEALISAWPRLVGWQREDAESARLRDALRASARQWVERAKPAGLLWRKEALAEYRLWRSRFGGRLTQHEEAFAAASLRDEAQALFIRRALGVAAFTTLLVGLAVVFSAYRKADHNAQVASVSAAEARARLQTLWQEQGRLANLAGKPMESLVYSSAAKSAGASGRALEHTLASSAAMLSGEDKPLASLRGRVRILEASQDGRLLLAFSVGEVRLFDLETSKQLGEWTVPCYAGAFTPAPERPRIVLACNDQQFRVIELPSLDMTVVPNGLQSRGLTKSPDGALFAPVVFGNALTVFDWSLKPRFTLTKGHAETMSFEFAPNGGGVLFAGPAEETPLSLRSAFFFDERGRELSAKGLPTHPIYAARFSSDGKWVALGGMNGSLALVDVATRAVRWSTMAHLGSVTSVGFDPSGARLLTSGVDGVVRVWSVSSGEPEALTAGAWGSVQDTAWLPDGSAFLFAAADGVIRRASFDGRVVWEYQGHAAGARSLCPIGDEAFVSGSEDGSIWRWPTRRSLEQPREHVASSWGRGTTVDATRAGLSVRGPGAESSSVASFAMNSPREAEVAVTPDGRSVVVSEGARVHLLERDRDHLRLVFTVPTREIVTSVAIRDDGAYLASVEMHGQIVIRSRTGETVNELSLAGDDYANYLAFDAQGRLVTNSDNGYLTVFAVPSATLESRTRAHSGFFVVRRDGSHLLTFGYDKTIRIWRDRYEQPRFQISGLPALPVDVVLDERAELAVAALPSGQLLTSEVSTGRAVSLRRLSKEPVRLSRHLDRLTVTLKAGDTVELAPFGAVSAEALEALLRCRVSLTLEGDHLLSRFPQCE